MESKTEALRSTYAAETAGEGARRFDAFVAKCKEAADGSSTAWLIPALRWRAEIIAYHSTAASSGRTNAGNLLVKKAVRLAVASATTP